MKDALKRMDEHCIPGCLIDDEDMLDDVLPSLAPWCLGFLAFLSFRAASGAHFMGRDTARMVNNPLVI